MYPNLPPLNSLKTFAIAAHFLSFKQAAQVLNLTPTAVSHQIKGLESQLGFSLFHRKTRALILTDQGQRLAEQCWRSLEALDLVLASLRAPKTRISISCCTSFASLWLAPRLAQLQNRYEDMSVEICASDELVSLELDRRLDVALRYGPLLEDAQEQPLGQEHLCLYGRPNAPLPRGPSGRVIVYVTQWPEGVLANLPWGEHLDKEQYEVRTFGQEQYVLQAALTGQGLGLLSQVMTASAVQEGWLVPLKEGPHMAGYGYGLRLSPYRQQDFRVQRVANWLAQSLAATLNAKGSL